MNDPKQGGDLHNRWTTLDGEKSGIMSRSEQYAEWTLPHVFPRAASNKQSSELVHPLDSIGARGVNHMANKVVTTLYRPQGAFFRLHVSKADKKKLEALSQDQNKADVGAMLAEVQAALDDAEQESTEYLDMVSYRPVAIHAAKLLIITGNSLMYHPEGKPVQVYSLRNYCVVRDIAGEVIEIMTRENKAFETFDNAVQDKLRANPKAGAKPYEDRSDVNIYTRIKLNGETKKYDVTQAADNVDISKPDMSWPKELLPWVPLTWNLVNGEDYGRGLVEDYAGAFHSIETFTRSLLNFAAIMGDIKFLVNPASIVDVDALNKAEPGSYHPGKPEDIYAIQLDKVQDAQFIQAMIERYERQIAQAFLLNSSITRDAERVTAEEIRMQANELDTSNGGVYSRLAHQWQVPTANIILAQTKFPAQQLGVRVKIITGMDSLSRQGELDTVRMFIADLALLDAVPEDIRAAINPLKFAQYVGSTRQVVYNQFLYSQDEMAANREQAMEANARMEQQKAAGAVATEAGKAAVNRGS